MKLDRMTIYDIEPWSEIRADDYKYLNVQYVGSGANCVTYQVVRAEKEGDYINTQDVFGAGNLFALKFFKRSSKEERRSRFLEERDFLDNTSHPSIMEYYDRGTWTEKHLDNDYPFLVTEYLSNTLEDVILADETSITDKLSYAVQLTSGLVYLSNETIVHRDIKPSNIFIKGGSCVLGDFGLMKRGDDQTDEDDTDLLKESAEEGIPYLYPTPDLVKYERDDKAITPKSDVFQLGIVLTELFSEDNQNPIKDVEERDKLGDVEVEFIDDFPGQKVSDGVKNNIISMLEVDPEERPSTEKLLGQWMKLYEIAASQSLFLNGRVI